MSDNKNWPAWYSGPNGETKVFRSADDVPPGWTTGAERRLASGDHAPKPAAKPAAAKPATSGPTKKGPGRPAKAKAAPAPKPGYPKPIPDLDL